MIVRPRPHPIQLLFILRGSIIPQIAPKILSITALSCLVVWLSRTQGFETAGGNNVAPFSIVGLALSVFLGFRNNACYDRWWEARKQWGDLIVQARSLARETGALLSDATMKARLARSTIGFAYALAARLRAEDMQAAARPWVPDDVTAGQRNVPDAILRSINRELVHCLRDGAFNDILYQHLVQRLHAMTGIQAACERILSTPTPFAYSLLLHRTAWLFCLLLPFGLVGSMGLMTPLIVTLIAYTFFGLDALGDELEEPFGILENDLPLSALVRVLEIDLLEGLGEKDLPEPLRPAGYVLR